MASSQITEALKIAFDKNRIVFWDDKGEKLLDEFNSLELPDVTKIKLDNNEFSVKYRILVTEKEHKFLIYRPEGKPSDKDNWLLDVQFASFVFVADQDNLRCIELGLEPLLFLDYFKEHEFFFRKKEYREKLKKEIDSKNETINSLNLKLIGILSPLHKVDSFNTILQSILKEEYEQSQNGLGIAHPEVCAHMETELKKILRDNFGYQSQKLSIYDFALKVFCDNLNKQLGNSYELKNEVSIFLDNWKDSKSYGENFKEWSERVFEELKLEDKFNTLDFDTLKNIDYFSYVDEKILTKLKTDITNDVISDIDVKRILDIRCTKSWWSKYSACYETAYAASRFKQLIKSLNLSLDSVEDAVDKYTKSWFEVDLQYRKFNFYCRKDVISELFSDLKVAIDNIYTNDFLRPLAQRFSSKISTEHSWGNFKNHTYQKDFFKKYIEPYSKKNNKITVIISDALRYELGFDLANIINQTNRFDATIEPMVSVLPSFTQLGMAALLPNNSIELKNDNTASVDGISATGLDNRSKILSNCQCKTSCYKASELLAPSLKNSDVKKILAASDIIYVYHDVIDNAGEKNEEHLFENVQVCLDELKQLVIKLSSGNANNIIITADHGFIYQDIKLDKNVDFVDAPLVIGEKYQVDRRFVTANGHLDASNSDFHELSSKDIGLSSDLAILIPKAIQRIKKQGQNGKYVHGGATLEETVIPVIHINKKRADNISEVDVKVISQERVITSGQISITFYQEQPVEEKVQGITIKAAFYRGDDIVSNTEDLEFRKEASSVEEREQKRQFKLSTNIESGTVELKLLKRIGNTEQYSPYTTIPFTIRQNFFGRDF